MYRVVLRLLLLGAVTLSPLLARAGTGVVLQTGLAASTNAVLWGEQYSFSISVSNASPTTATGVILSDTLPSSWQYLYSETSQGTVDVAGGSATFTLGILPPGSAASMRIFVLPQSPGIFTNVAVASANEVDPGTSVFAELPVSVFVASPPVITSQPQDQLLDLGGLLRLVVDVLPAPGTRFQWRLNGANVPGATNSTYSVLNLTAKDAGSYTAVVYNQLGATVSQPALISLTGLLQLQASDNFAQRAPFLNLVNLIRYSNVGATAEPGESMHAGVPGGRSVWFTWTPLLSGVATFSTAGSSFDTLLAVYTGNSLSNLTEVASDDDSDGFYTSKVAFNAVAGTQYSIAVDGAYGAQGNIILNSSLKPLAPSVPRIVTSPKNQVTVLGGNASFSAAAVGNALAYQWFFDDVAIPGATSSALAITNIGPDQVGLYRIRVSSGSQSLLSAPATLQIGSIDGLADSSAVSFDKLQAKAYAATEIGTTSVGSAKAGLRVSSSGGHIRRLVGGASRGYTGMQIFSTYGSATQTQEPNNCSTPGGASSWTSLQPPENGALSLSTIGSNFKTILGVYTGNGTDFSSLVPVACDVGINTNSNNATVTFAATANTLYYVSVDGVDSAYGKVVLSWNLGVPPAITSEPFSQSLEAGTSVTLNVTATGSPAPKCQWFCNGSAISGATNWSLTITNFQAPSQGTYQAFASNPAGSATTAPSALFLNSGLRFDSTALRQVGGVMQLSLVGSANTRYVIQASSDLLNWVPMATNSATTGVWGFDDSQFGAKQRFYRAVPQ